MSHVLLVGFMCSGKSTVGSLLARRMGRDFIDLDERVEQETGRSVRETFETLGEAAFRSAERDALLSLAAEPDSVVACGGGIVTNPLNREALRELGTVVWLRVSPSTARRRAGGAKSRPLLDGKSAREVSDLAEAREALYREVADLEVDTEGVSPAEAAEVVLQFLGGGGA